MRTPQEFKRSEERLAGGSHASDRRESQCGMRCFASAECGMRNVECGMWNDLLLWSVLHTRTHISRYVLTDSICCCATRYATSLLDMICSLFLTSRFAEAKHLVSAGHIVPARAIVRPRGAYRREENYRFLRLAQFSWLD